MRRRSYGGRRDARRTGEDRASGGDVVLGQQRAQRPQAAPRLRHAELSAEAYDRAYLLGTGAGAERAADVDAEALVESLVEDVDRHRGERALAYAQQLHSGAHARLQVHVAGEARVEVADRFADRSRDR